MGCGGSKLRKIILTSLLFLTGCSGSSTTSSSPAQTVPGSYGAGGYGSRYNTPNASGYRQQPQYPSQQMQYPNQQAQGYGAESRGGGVAYDPIPANNSGPMVGPLMGDNRYQESRVTRAVGANLTEEQRQRIVEQSLTVDIPEQGAGGQWETSNIRLSQISKLDLHRRLLALYQNIQNLQAQLQRRGGGTSQQPANVQQQMQQMQQQMAQIQQQLQISQGQLKRVSDIVQASPGEDPMVKLQTIMATASAGSSSKERGGGSDMLYNKLLTELGVTDQTEAYEKISELQEAADAASDVKGVQEELEDTIASVRELVGIDEDEDLVVAVQEIQEKAAEDKTLLESKLDSLKELLPEALRGKELEDAISELASSYEKSSTGTSEEESGSTLAAEEKGEEVKETKDNAEAEEETKDNAEAEEETKDNAEKTEADAVAIAESKADSKILNDIKTIFPDKYKKDQLYNLINRLYKRYITMQKTLKGVKGKTTPDKFKRVWTFAEGVRKSLGIESYDNTLSIALEIIQSLRENQPKVEKDKKTEAVKQGDTKAEEERIKLDPVTVKAEEGPTEKEPAKAGGEESPSGMEAKPGLKKAGTERPSALQKRATAPSGLADRFRNLGKRSLPEFKPKTSAKASAKTDPDSGGSKAKTKKPLFANLKTKSVLPPLKKKTTPKPSPSKETPEAESVEERNKRKQKAMQELKAMLEKQTKPFGISGPSVSKPTAPGSAGLAKPKPQPKPQPEAASTPPPTSKAESMAKLKAMLDKGVKFKVESLPAARAEEG